VSAEIHEKFVRAAEANGRTLSEEVTQRACQSFEWEAAHETAQAMLAKVARVTKETAQAELVRELQRRGSAWFDPGVDSITWIADPALLDDLLDRAVARTLETIAARALAKSQTKPRRKS
jgi:hypothetical protein